MSWSKQVGGSHRQIREANFEMRMGGPSPQTDPNHTAKKSLVCQDLKVNVPLTDTRRRGENHKVLEIALVKELGKMTP